MVDLGELGFRGQHRFLAGDSLTFAGSVNMSPNNNLSVNTQFNGITFDATAGVFSVSGSAINLAGNITDNSLNAQTISLPMALQGTSTVNVATIDSSLTLSGLISGAAGLTKTGNGLLSKANTFAGPVTVSGASSWFPATPTSAASQASHSMARLAAYNASQLAS